MKKYGVNKSTEFSSKQIGALFHKAKDGELKIERWYINHLYNLAEYYGYDDNGSVEKEEAEILHILDLMFKGELEKCQELIEKEEEKEYNLLSNKAKKTASRATL